MEDRPRKLKRTFNEPGHAHFLTFSCFHQLPLLSKDNSRRWLVDALQKARDRHRFEIYGYVIMPEHVHLLVRPREEIYKMERFLADIKRSVSWNAKNFLIESGNEEWMNRLTVVEGSKKVFRFWQAGGGFDKNILYEKSLWPVVEYIHGNPVRRELVDIPTEWIWSSARFWDGEVDVPLRMDAPP
jgi:putative transposase